MIFTKVKGNSLFKFRDFLGGKSSIQLINKGF